MPLKKGKSKEVISSNIGEIMRSFHMTGKIGNSTPQSEEAANRQADAIAYSKAGKSKRKK